jgi:membrane-associated phospholipid phosphatase
MQLFPDFGPAQRRLPVREFMPARARRRRVLRPLTLSMRAAALVAGLVLCWIAVDFFKAAYDRPRPPGMHVETDGMAYPSGHATYAIAWLACAVALVRGGAGLATRFAVVTIAIVIAVVVGLTRVYLRAHYLSDVDGGFGLAATIFGLCGLVALVVGHVRQNGEPQR